MLKSNYEGHIYIKARNTRKSNPVKFHIKSSESSDERIISNKIHWRKLLCLVVVCLHFNGIDQQIYRRMFACELVIEFNHALIPFNGESY